jgi:peroxiredoxin
MKKTALFSVLILAAAVTFGQGYKPGDKAEDFKLKGVDGKMVSMADYPDAKGFIVIFTCNTCPYAVAYEDRIIALDRKYKPLGYPVIAINPNNPEVQAGDSFDKMVERAKSKGFTFPYLLDEGQKVYPVYGATHTPHVYILNKQGNDLIVSYTGTIDNNYKDAAAADVHYVSSTIDALKEGRGPQIATTKAIGCTIKK